ncbi:MAG: sodium:solute symporter, partial [Bacillota bacterium]|nr:sodium:solute symporter [Bacillota bacterium]
APFLYGLYWKGVSRAACYTCFVWGCGLMIMQMIVSFAGIDVTAWGSVPGYFFASSVRSGVIAMVGSLIIVPLVSLFTAKQDAKSLDDMFACYEERVSVVRTEALD